MSGLRSLHEDIQEVLFDEATLQRRVRELAAELERDYAGLRPLLVGMLRGSVYFLADLSRALCIPHEIDFMAIAAYGSRHAATGAVRLLKDLDEEITDRHVVLVEDIVDTGLTAAYLTRLLRARRPASLVICTLLDKRVRRIAPNLPLAYVGFEVPDRFVVGYGLDYRQLYRNLPYIGVLRDEVLRAAEVP
ncbi:MAG: hypoxanthine phosphoribosyltransferase [Armatimonadota bacterium]|nr:hypoxanthine phosphoribosyltransferase [Armatimonadota bacterium]MDW8155155.1 hypoxanthine phosphoribosyltransferase [Armatimonadota bacterium]